MKRPTHPPLQRETFRSIARRLTSDDARLLLREIERLKAMERLVTEAFTLPAGDPARGRIRAGLVEVLQGVVQGPTAFGLLPELQESRSKRSSEGLPPMNYRSRGAVVAAAAAAGSGVTTPAPAPPVLAPSKAG